MTDENQRQNVKWDKHTRKVGAVVTAHGERIASVSSQGIKVYEIRVRLPQYQGGDHLATVRGSYGDQRVVGFHGARIFDDAIVGALDKVVSGTMKWREDKPMPR